MKEEFNRIFKKYKKQIFPIVLIGLSVFIVFRVILPQISEITSTSQKISQKKEELVTLSNSVATLSTLNDQNLTSNLKLTTTALPTSKDITKIFSALTSAASAANAELLEFSLKVGGVYGGDSDKSPTRSVIGAPHLSVVARIGADDADAIVAFAKAVNERLPLSEVKKIEANSAIGTFELDFFYKPADLNLISKQDKVSPISQADQNLINQLNSWDK